MLHTLASGLVGYYWAKGILQKSLTKNILIGLTLATIIHTVFNVLVLNLENRALYPLLLLIVTGFFILNDFEKLKNPSPEDLNTLANSHA